MHFRAAASAAILACATHVAAEAAPYKLAMMPVPGLSLLRRDTNGYQPAQTTCNDGNTCAEACGGGYTECPSNGDGIHCFNPQANQQCCYDGNGNSCDAGYYCSHDTTGETWCCPDSMDLAACAAAYSVTGGLETATRTTSTTSSSSSSSTSSVMTTTNTTTTMTTSCGSSSGYSTVWTGVNSTITTKVPTQPSESAPVHLTSTATQAPTTSATSAAGTNSVSALLLAAAGLFAFL